MQPFLLAARVRGPRVALVGPLPPELGGATAGGVATHQAYLAAGLAEAGLDVHLLATNVPVGGPGLATNVPGAFGRAASVPGVAGLASNLAGGSTRASNVPGAPVPASNVHGAAGLATSLPGASDPASNPSGAPRLAANTPVAGPDATLGLELESEPRAWPGLAGLARVPTLGMCPLRWRDPGYLRTVGPPVLARYGLRLAGLRVEGSRRDLLGQLVWYRAFLCATRPALVHVQHPLERQRLVQHVLAAERARLPVVVTAHGLFGEHPPEIIERLMAPNLRAADRVIAVSPHVADQAVELGAARERVRVIRSGVDVERFRPRDRLLARRALGWSAPSDVPLVLFVGNLEPRKQLEVLLRALLLVRQRLPGARLAIVGSGRAAGSGDQTQRLQRLAHELGLGLAVDFVGAVDGDDLLRWYAAADVFALPSSAEAQGIVALEAMACGLPVVASAVGGLLGTIDPGKTGELVPPGDPAALAECLGRLLTDPARRARLGLAARQQVERDFSWQRAAQATIELYQELLACR